MFERYSGLASVLVVGSLLSLTDSQAQQRQFGGVRELVIAEKVDQTPQRNEQKLNLPFSSFDQVAGSFVAFVGDKPGKGESLGGPPAADRTGLPNANEIGPAFKPEPPAPLALTEVAKLSLLDQAYLDVFSILREENECSRFFGGPPAIEALNELKLQLKTAYFDPSVAVRMAGQTSSALNYQSGFSYRLFEKAELNMNGPFYRSKVFPGQPSVPGVGEFAPDTREARATILLHELGHMIKKADKIWVLPNDGYDPSLSRENTLRVINVCRAQISGLQRTSFAQQLSKARAPQAVRSQLSEMISRH